MKAVVCIKYGPPECSSLIVVHPADTIPVKAYVAPPLTGITPHPGAGHLFIEHCLVHSKPLDNNYITEEMSIIASVTCPQKLIQL